MTRSLKEIEKDCHRARGCVLSPHFLLYIPKLVRELWLVNLAGRTLLHGPLKFEGFLSPNCCAIYYQFFSSYEANNSLKLSFTLNCKLKHANDLKRFQIDSFCFRPGSEIWSRSSWREIVPNSSDTQQGYNKYLTNLVFLVRTVSYGSSFSPYDLWPACFALGPEIEGQKTRSVTYGTDLKLG